MALKIVQVYYDDDSKRNCKPEWQHYDNSERLTEFFENQVIYDLWKAGDIKGMFGVFSHDFEVAFKEEGLRFSPETLERIINKYPEVDLFSFQKRRKQKNIATQAEHYHPGITKMFERVLEHAGMPGIPDELPDIVLFNHFVAKESFWNEYITELLEPAMECLRDMPEAYGDSNYHRISSRKMTPERTSRFKKAFNLEYYPYHPFICERLPSIFLRKKRYHVKQIF